MNEYHPNYHTYPVANRRTPVLASFAGLGVWAVWGAGDDFNCTFNFMGLGDFEMKLSNVIKIWDELHIRDTGELGFSDLERAIDKVVGVKNDIITPGDTVTIGGVNVEGGSSGITRASNVPFSLTH